jgi:hypothetical protein
MSNGNLKDMYYRELEIVSRGFSGNTLEDYSESKKLGSLYKILGAVGDDYYCIELMSPESRGCELTGIVRLVYIGTFDDGFLYETLITALGHKEMLVEKYGEEPESPLQT